MLKQICSQPWVREKFLSSPEGIVSMEKTPSAEVDNATLLEPTLEPNLVSGSERERDRWSVWGATA